MSSNKKWWRTKRDTSVHFTPDGNFCLYHDTPVVQWTDKEIILDNGTWDSMTTRSRMNQCASEYDLNFSVYRDRGVTKVVVVTGHYQEGYWDKSAACSKAFKTYIMDEEENTTVRFRRTRKRKKLPKNCGECALKLLANA